MSLPFSPAALAQLPGGVFVQSALLKIKRAEKHIDDLRRAFNQFVSTQEHKLCVTNEPKTGELLFEVRFNRSIPPDLALIAGDGHR